MYNATNDFTEQDKAIYQYKKLMANKFMGDVEKQEKEALKKTVLAAVRDISFWLLIMAFFALAIILATAVQLPDKQETVKQNKNGQ